MWTHHRLFRCLALVSQTVIKIYVQRHSREFYKLLENWVSKQTNPLLAPDSKKEAWAQKNPAATPLLAFMTNQTAGPLSAFSAVSLSQLTFKQVGADKAAAATDFHQNVTNLDSREMEKGWFPPFSSGQTSGVDLKDNWGLVWFIRRRDYSQLDLNIPHWPHQCNLS